MPVVNRVRESAGRAFCASKQRQLVQGTYAYMADWDGFGPPQGGTATYTTPNWKWAQYPQALDKYFGFNTPMSGGLIQLKGKARGIEMYYGAAACPSAKPVTDPNNIIQISSPDDGNSNWAFGANGNVLDVGYFHLNPANVSRWYRLTTFRGEDLRVFLFMDCPGRSVAGGGLQINTAMANKRRHLGQGANFAFVDAHVEFIPYDRDLGAFARNSIGKAPYLHTPANAKPVQSR